MLEVLKVLGVLEVLEVLEVQGGAGDPWARSKSSRPQDLKTSGPQDLRTSGPQDPRTSPVVRCLCGVAAQAVLAVASLTKNARALEHAKYARARFRRKSEEPGGLLHGEGQARHFPEFSLDAAEKRLTCFGVAPLPAWSMNAPSPER